MHARGNRAGGAPQTSLALLRARARRTGRSVQVQVGGEVVQAQAAAARALVLGEVRVAHDKAVAARLLRLLLLLLGLAVLPGRHNCLSTPECAGPN